MNHSETSLQDEAASQLQILGFFVEREVRLSRGTNGPGLRADLVAWAPDESGELVRDLVVEVKGGRFPQLSLAKLSRIASVAGARRAFFFTGDWLAVDPSFTETRPSPAPYPRHQPERVRVPAGLLQDVLRRLLWVTQHAARDAGEARDDIRSVAALLSQLQVTPNSGDMFRLAQTPGAELSVTRILASIPDDVGVSLELASCLARLLQPTDRMAVLDPFCRLGGCLWGVADEVRQQGASVELFGWERNETAADLTRQLGAFAQLEVSVEALDIPPSLQGQLLLDTAAGGRPTRTLFDAVVSVLPLNAKSPRVYGLATGEQTHSIDLAALDAVGDWLKPGGRAVLVVAPRLLFAEGDAARVRERLAGTMRVVAVIELPAGALKNTRIPCGIVVLEKSAPAATLVGRLTDDWLVQLSADGEFMRTYREHLLGPRSR